MFSGPGAMRETRPGGDRAGSFGPVDAPFPVRPRDGGYIRQKGATGFVNRPPNNAPPGRFGAPQAGPSRFGADRGDGRDARRGGANPNPRKRMMAQGRKGHFMHDAKAALLGNEGKMDETYVRAFLEGVFQRGTRQSTEEALLYLDEKVAEGTVSKDQGNALADLIERYSFWR